MGGIGNEAASDNFIRGEDECLGHVASRAAQAQLQSMTPCYVDDADAAGGHSMGAPTIAGGEQIGSCSAPSPGATQASYATGKGEDPFSMTNGWYTSLFKDRLIVDQKDDVWQVKNT